LTATFKPSFLKYFLFIQCTLMEEMIFFSIFTFCGLKIFLFVWLEHKEWCVILT
jgi:hypothetical protein